MTNPYPVPGKLLVYGSLLPGVRERGPLLTFTEGRKATLPGYEMFSLGAFPAIRADRGRPESVVLGEVVTVESVAQWEALDYLEGFDPRRSYSFYRRELVTVLYEDGSPDEVAVYVCGQPERLDPYEPVAGGDWRAFLELAFRERLWSQR